MTTFAASMARQEFSKLLDYAQKSPVTIQKKGRDVAILISIDDYEGLEAAEDALLALRAQQAEAEGLLSFKESRKLLDSISV